MRIVSHVGLILLTFVCVIVYMTNSTSTYDLSDAVFCLISVGIGIVLYINNQQHSQLINYWVRPSNLLLLGLLIVNFQYVLDMVLGFKSLSDFERPDSVYKCCYVSAIGINAFLVGVTFPIKKTLTKNDATTSELHFNLMFLVFLQVVSLMVWLYKVNIVTLVLGLQYGYGDTSSDIFEFFFNNVNIVLLACVAINSRNAGVKTLKGFFKQNNVVSWLCIAIYMIIRLLSGDRGPFIYTAFAVFYAFVYETKFKFRITTVLFAAIFASIFISLVGMARRDVTSGNFMERMGSSFTEFRTSKGRFSDRTVLSSTEELALSYKCNEIAVDEIDKGKEPLHRGKYQIYQILNCIPFMPSFFANTLHLAPKEVSSDYLLTDLYFGDYYMSGQIGTTCIADLYLDFGSIGVFIGLFLMGLFFRQVDSVICLETSISVIILIIALLYSSRCIYISRSTLLSPIKPIIVVLVIYYANYLLFNTRIRQH